MLTPTTAKEVIEFLSKFDDNAHVYAYEGETTGIVVIDPKNKDNGFLEAYPPDYWSEIDSNDRRQEEESTNTQG